MLARELYCIAGDLSVVILRASPGLADAGIMMYDLITTVSVVCNVYATTATSIPLNYFLSQKITCVHQQEQLYIIMIVHIYKHIT